MKTETPCAPLILCIQCSNEELSRPENKDLKGLVDKLKGIKQRIDSEDVVSANAFFLTAIHRAAHKVPGR